MIVVTTPTGDIGSQVLKNLVQSKEAIRVIARDPSRIPAELRERVEVIEGSHGDTNIVSKAFAGADTLFWLVPDDYSSNNVDTAYADFSRPAAQAIKQAGVKRVVAISALGRGWKGHAGLVTGSINGADLIASTGVPLRVLMMPSFMDNLLGQAETIKEKGMFFSPIHADLKLPTVATSDIAAVAAKFLLDHSWTGQADVPVLGPEDLSQNELARTMSEVLVKPVRFQETTMEAFKSKMAGFGMSEAVAQAYVNMMTAKNEGVDNTGSRAAAASTPTTFRQWCEKVLKPAVVN